MTLSSISHHLPRDVAAAINKDSLRRTSTKDLFKGAKEILERADFKKYVDNTNFLNKIIMNLNLRKLSGNEKSDLNRLKSKTKRATNCLIIHKENAPEAAGVRIKNKTHHVYGQAVKKQYQKWQKEKTSKSFDEYLSKHISKKDYKKIKENTVKYFKPHEAKKCEISFDKHNYIMQNHHKMPSGVYMFTISADGKKMYAGSKVKGKRHHSSFTAGNPVRCAGNLMIKHGRLITAKLDSGHYQPDSKCEKELRKYLSQDHCLGSAAKRFKIIHH